MLKIENRKNTDNYAYGKKSVSKLHTSNYNLNRFQKAIIKMSLEYDIIDIRTYAGYKGDLVVQITSSCLKTLESLEKCAGKLNMECIIKTNPNLMIYELYCMYPNDVYDIK